MSRTYQFTVALAYETMNNLAIISAFSHYNSLHTYTDKSIEWSPGKAAEVAMLNRANLKAYVQNSWKMLNHGQSI